MSDGDALLKAILLHPAEDTARLVYADWLQENGQPERAEFIRLQCRIARADPFDGWECKVCGNRPLYQEGFDLGEVEHGRGCYTQNEDGGGSEFVDVAPAYLALRAREHQILDRGQIRAFCAMPLSDWGHDIRSPSPEHVGRRVVWNRGFVEWVVCPASDWLPHAAAITAAHPIERMTITDWTGHPEILEARYLEDRWPRITFEIHPFNAAVPPAPRPRSARTGTGTPARPG